jgi:hypothetical protein
MRRIALVTAMLAALACAPPALADHGSPGTHGPDPESIDEGPDLPKGPYARAASSTSLPKTWCGDELTTDDKRNELDNGEYRFHAVYAIPADAPSRLKEVAGIIQTDAMRASGLIEQLYGRAIRYDMGTGCGSQYIDITVVRLAETTAELESLKNTRTGTLEAVARALDRNGMGVIKGGEAWSTAAARTRNWVVWLDGPAPDNACGQAMLYDDARRTDSNYNNLGGKVAVIFRNGGNFCGANTVRHEIAHTMGAVVSKAPNASGEGHCTDAFEDTMCLPTAPNRASGAYHELFFDYGNDDYWDPAGGALPWWTVNLNRFLCENATCNLPGGYTPPTPASGDGSQTEGATSTRRRARVSVEARRYARQRWSVQLRVRGRGRGVVSLSCRTGKGKGASTVWSRRTRIPRTLRKRVRCASKPRAVAYYETASGAKASVAAERWRTAHVTLRRSGGRWRLKVRVRTRGQATVRVHCPTSSTRGRIAWTRTLRAPRTATASVRCSRTPLVGVI